MFYMYDNKRMWRPNDLDLTWVQYRRICADAWLSGILTVIVDGRWLAIGRD